MRSDRQWWTTASICASVIAVCYGFGRYAYGLFVPQFAEVFDLGATGIGILGGISTFGYTLGLTCAPWVSRASSRTATVIAGGCAAAGLSIMGISEPLGLFACGLLLAGGSAGLVSPAVAQLVGETVRAPVRPQAQTWANSGTSFGLAASAFTPVLVFGWRETWLGLGLLAAGAAVLALLALPKTGTRPETAANAQASSRDSHRWHVPGLVLLLSNSLLLGLTSAPYWNFSIERVQEAGLGTHVSSWFWLVIGLAGPIGGLAGVISSRFGLTRTNIGTWTLWAISLGLLGVPDIGPVGSLVSGAAFGASYMALTGLCIVWAARIYPHMPARGVTLSFFSLGVGQTLGSPLAGALADISGLATVFAVVAVMSLLTWLQALPRLRCP